MNNVAVKIIFNNEPPTKYDYKYFDVIMKTGKVHSFHHHKNNPIPNENEMIGLTWYEIKQLILKKWYEFINA